MENFYAFLILIFIGFLSWLFHFIANSGILTEDEIKELAHHRRFSRIVEHFGFQNSLIEINLEFKKKLKASGGYYKVKEDLNNFPSLVAALLKGKKHEWIIIGFSKGNEVVGLWANKGENNMNVPINLSHDTCIDTLKLNEADTILFFHNHTNAILNPSETDLNVANIDGIEYNREGFNYIAFIVGRGNYKQYAWWVLEDLLPINNFIEEIEEANGVKATTNYNMRMENRRLKNFRKINLVENASATNIF